MTALLRLSTLILGITLAAGCAQGGDVTPVTEDQKALYEMGQQLSRRIAVFELDESELDYVTAGLRDGALGNEPKVDAGAGGDLRAFLERRQTGQASAEKEAGKAFLAKEASEPGATTTESGLVFRVVEEGDGPMPTSTDTVKVHYHGTLRDGTVFDSSVDRGEPAVFPLGRVVPCWQEALQLMKEGSKARVVCPSHIAYGDRGSPPTIKPGAALAFDVELLNIMKKKPE